MGSQRHIGLLAPEETNQVLNETEGTDPPAHRFADQNAHNKKGRYRNKRENNACVPPCEHQLNASERITHVIRAQPPCPKNRKHKRQRTNAENCRTEKDKR
jgi:hypothetical protein